MPDKDRNVPVTYVYQKNFTSTKYISRSARWSLRCKNTYYPTENLWQVQLTGKPLALFFFSREFRYFLVLLKNTVRGEQLDVVLKECEGNNHITLQRSQPSVSRNHYVGYSCTSEAEYLSPKYWILGDCLSQITVASSVFPELWFHRARDEIWVELQIPGLPALSSAVAACPENCPLEPALPGSVHHAGHPGTLMVHTLRESLQGDWFEISMGIRHFPDRNWIYWQNRVCSPKRNRYNGR